jgi:hypothetical protein
LVALTAACICLTLAAQDDQPTPTIEGYIKATHAPDGFEVSGKHVDIWLKTVFRRIDDQGNQAAVSGIYDLRVGMYVQVEGHEQAGTIIANSILITGDATKELKGFGLIFRVTPSRSESIFGADGYRIRITSATMTRFSGGLKSLADVGPNTWIKYACIRNQAGDLVALNATFIPSSSRLKSAAEMARDSAFTNTIPAKARMIDAYGNFAFPHDKVRMGDAGGPCSWHNLSADPALQARVWRVGMSVVPTFQKTLPAGSADRIHFRFFAVEDSQVRSELYCNGGLILVPRAVAERLSSDAELAAVLADGVAWFLQWQSSAVILEHRVLVGAEIAAPIATNLPVGIAAGETLKIPFQIELRKQRDRMALALLAEAGYDPWTAPEAWRLLAPRELPHDTSQLKSPSRSDYQLTILNEEYGKDAQTASAASGRPSTVPGRP